MSDTRIAFLVSGNGTLFESLTMRCQKGEIEAQSVLLISSNPDAPALQRAKRLDIPTEILQRKSFSSDTEYECAFLESLAGHNANLVCLAGYLKLIPPAVVRAFRHRMLNIHPALLPSFGGKGMYGKRVHEAVLEYGARISGATVHVVDEEFDHGPIVLQRAVFVRGDDTPDTLAGRVHEIEHELYADAVRLFAENRIIIDGRRVTILPKKTV